MASGTSSARRTRHSGGGILGLGARKTRRRGCSTTARGGTTRQRGDGRAWIHWDSTQVTQTYSGTLLTAQHCVLILPDFKHLLSEELRPIFKRRTKGLIIQSQHQQTLPRKASRTAYTWITKVQT